MKVSVKSDLVESLTDFVASSLFAQNVYCGFEKIKKFKNYCSWPSLKVSVNSDLVGLSAEFGIV